MVPFQQLPFDALPERPRLPHRWEDARQERISLRSDAFGPLQIALRTYGEGPPLLLVHGLMTAGYSWRYALEPLGERFTLFIPDLPGSGRSDHPLHGYPPDHFAIFLGELVRALGITGCPAIGNSLGGYLCMRLAMRDPVALGALVNLHGPGLPLRRLYALRALLSLPGSRRLLQFLVHADPERWVHRNVHYYDESLKSREETREYAEPLRTLAGVQAFGQILHDTLDPTKMRSFLEQLGPDFPIPLLLVYADRDPVVPPRVGDVLRARIPTAHFRQLKQASHFAHVDALDRFLDAALPFLLTHASPRRSDDVVRPSTV